MSRDDRDPYTDAKTGTLHNKLDITDPKQLAQAETDFTKLRIAELREKPLQGAYDLKHLQGFHQRIFGDVYPWAGELRTVDISKGSSMFARPEYIESESTKVFAALAKDNHLKGMDRDQFIDRTAYHLTEINALHPFREGNGRAQYAMFEQMGREARRPLDFSRIDRNDLIKAASLAHNHDYQHLKPIVEQALDAGQRLEAERRVPPAPESVALPTQGKPAPALDRIPHRLTAALERRALAVAVEPGPDGGAYFTHPLGEQYHNILSERGFSNAVNRAPNGDITLIDAAKLPPPNRFDDQLDAIERTIRAQNTRSDGRADEWNVAYGVVAAVEHQRTQDRERAQTYLREAATVPLNQRDRTQPEHHAETALITTLQDVRAMTPHIAVLTKNEIRHSIAAQLASGDTPRADESAQASVHLHVATRNLDAAIANREVGLIMSTSITPAQRQLITAFAEAEAGRWDRLSPQQQQDAKHRFTDIGDRDDKHSYAINGDGTVLSRKTPDTQARPLPGYENSPRFTPERLAQQIARYDYPHNDNPFHTSTLVRAYAGSQAQIHTSTTRRNHGNEASAGHSASP